jgi:hypothetical protein
LGKILLPPFRNKRIRKIEESSLNCFHKKTKQKVGKKVLSGPIKYISVDPKDASIDLYETGFQTWFSNPLFISERRKYYCDAEAV